MADAALLAEVPLFKLLDDQERADLAAQVDHRTFPAQTMVFHTGDPGNAMYVVRAGEVEIFVVDNSGHRTVLEVCKSGDFFGELSLFDGGARSASAQALTDVDALEVDRGDLDVLFRMHP